MGHSRRCGRASGWVGGWVGGVKHSRQSSLTLALFVLGISHPAPRLPTPQAGCQRLGPHLGPVLFQFPANFKTVGGKGKDAFSNIDRLRRLAEVRAGRCCPFTSACAAGVGPMLPTPPLRASQVLPAGRQWAFEFRDASWFCEEVYGVLRENNWCLVMPVMTGAPSWGGSSASARRGAECQPHPGKVPHTAVLQPARAYCDPAPARPPRADASGGRRLEQGGWIGSMAPGPNPPPERYPLDCCSSLAYVRFHGATGKVRWRHAGWHGEPSALPTAPAAVAQRS